MNVDAAFYTGKTHAVCQDFTRFRKGDNPLAILCDGCSGSPDTDTGARLLALAAERTFAVNDSYPYGDFASVVITTANGMVDGCGLPKESLDATLLISTVLPEYDIEKGDAYVKKPVIYTKMYGDGVVVVKRKDGSIWVYSVEYMRGYPYYLNYRFNSKRDAAWYATAVGQSKPDEKKNVVGHVYLLNPDWSVNKEYKTDYEPKVASAVADWGTREPTAEEKAEYAKVLPHDVPFFIDPRGSSVVSPVDETEWVAMLSDGVLTFSEKPSEPGKGKRLITLPEVLKDLLDFRNFNGEFVKRQANWFVRECLKRNWQHDDDLSVAAVYTG